MRTQWPKCSRNRKWKWLQRHPGGDGRRDRFCPLRLLQRRHGQTPGVATRGGTEEGRKAGECVRGGVDGRGEVLLYRCVFSREGGGVEGGRGRDWRRYWRGSPSWRMCLPWHWWVERDSSLQLSVQPGVGVVPFYFSSARINVDQPIKRLGSNENAETRKISLPI